MFGQGGSFRFPVREAVVILFVFLWRTLPAFSDVVINVLAVNGSDKSITKEIQFSLPGEIKPDDVVETAGLKLDYSANDAGYYLHGEVSLQAKETKTLRVKVRDIWQLTPQGVNAIKSDIDLAFREMGSEKNKENGEKLRQRLIDKLDYIVADQAQSEGSVETRIDIYRNHVQTLNDIRSKTRAIDYWRSDADEPENTKNIYYKVSVENPGDKTKKIKQQHYLPAEVLPEYIVDRKGYEVRFDDKKGLPFLFKEEDIASKEKKEVSFGIRDMWYVRQNEMKYVRERSKYINDILAKSKLAETSKALFQDITNNLELVELLQKMEQPDIQQHIGAFRINKGRFDKATADLDDLEKLLSRHRADLEKSKVKNVLQKMQSLKSLARVSQAIFDKKPTVNAAWKLIGSITIFLGIFTIIHFLTWFLRSSRERKQELLKEQQDKEQDANKA